MKPTDVQEARTHQGVLAYDFPAIRAAQRLAALDPDIRIAMSEVWWAALRVGLALGSDRPLLLPHDPFGAKAMEDAGINPGDF
jgi:hypothetical protein